MSAEVSGSSRRELLGRIVRQAWPVLVSQWAGISFGVLDTAMQEEIRASRAEDFPLVGKFIGFKEKGALRSCEEVAAAVIELLNQPELENGAHPILRVNMEARQLRRLRSLDEIGPGDPRPWRDPVAEPDPDG